MAACCVVSTLDRAFYIDEVQACHYSHPSAETTLDDIDSFYRFHLIFIYHTTQPPLRKLTVGTEYIRLQADEPASLGVCGSRQGVHAQ